MRRGEWVTEVGEGVGVGVEVGVGLGVGVGADVGVGVGDGDGVSEGAGLGVGVGDSEGDGVGLGVEVGEGVGLGVDVGLGDGVGDGDGVGEAVGLGDGVGVGVSGVGVSTFEFRTRPSAAIWPNSFLTVTSLSATSGRKPRLLVALYCARIPGTKRIAEAPMQLSVTKRAVSFIEDFLFWAGSDLQKRLFTHNAYPALAGAHATAKYQRIVRIKRGICA
ncbi:MAG: hypothetical protein ABSH26_01165 [Opitutaceae bacterium]|jgi:hypothetical protein